MLTFNKKYFSFTVLLFLIELSIALFVHDRFIRPYIGDFLVVILIYCFVKSFIDVSVWRAALMVLAFSFCVEFTQYLNVIEKMGLQDSGIAKAILGNSFSWLDVVTYVAGILVVIVIEKVNFRNSN